MRPRSIGKVVIGIVLAAVAIVGIGGVRLNRRTRNRIETLLSSAEPRTEDARPTPDLEDVPTPVRRYFTAALEDGFSPVRSVRLEQRGEFRLGGRSGSWKPMRATQHYTVEPPGFIWDATIEISPFLPTRVIDAYEFGRGSLRATVLSVLPVANADPSPELNEGELLRYLAEAVWFPTALSPDAGVEWEAIDDRSARATIEDRGTTASLVFHFGDDDLVERVHAPDRYRQESGTTAPWTGRFDQYEWVDGVRIPMSAAVEWNLPDGDLPYWRARITSIEHRRGGSGVNASLARSGSAEQE